MRDDRLETLHEGKFLRLVRRGGWEYVERRAICGIVAVVAVTAEQRLVLIEQFRPPLATWVIEIPAGLAGDGAFAGEQLASAAQRELLEETGFAAASFTHLFDGPPSAGLSTEMVSFFRAEGVRRTAAGGGDGSENIRVHEVPLAQVEDWLRDRVAGGCVVDPRVYVALWFAGRH